MALKCDNPPKIILPVKQLTNTKKNIKNLASSTETSSNTICRSCLTNRAKRLAQPRIIRVRAPSSPSSSSAAGDLEPRRNNNGFRYETGRRKTFQYVSNTFFLEYIYSSCVHL